MLLLIIGVRLWRAFVMYNISHHFARYPMPRHVYVIAPFPDHNDNKARCTAAVGVAAVLVIVSGDVPHYYACGCRDCLPHAAADIVLEGNAT